MVYPAHIVKTFKRIGFITTIGFIGFGVPLGGDGLFDVFDNLIASVLDALMFVARRRASQFVSQFRDIHIVCFTSRPLVLLLLYESIEIVELLGSGYRVHRFPVQ